MEQCENLNIGTYLLSHTYCEFQMPSLFKSVVNFIILNKTRQNITIFLRLTILYQKLFCVTKSQYKIIFYDFICILTSIDKDERSSNIFVFLPRSQTIFTDTDKHKRHNISFIIEMESLQSLDWIMHTNNLRFCDNQNKTK